MAEIKIVGTAHVSQQSVDEVRQAIDEFTLRLLQSNWIPPGSRL